MNEQSIEKFLKLRAELEGEMIDVDSQIEEGQLSITEFEGQIADVRLRVAQLGEYREQLQQALAGETTTAKVEEMVESDLGLTPVNAAESEIPRIQSDVLYTFIKNNPGSDRNAIREGVLLEDNTVGNLMSRMSKNGEIVNRGNKRYSKWYVVKGKRS